MKTGEDILRDLKSHEDRIHNFGVKRIGLFGSYAYGSPSKTSDIDILIEFEDGKKTFDNYMDLKAFLEQILGAKVDLVIKNAIKDRLRSHILKGVRYVS